MPLTFNKGVSIILPMNFVRTIIVQKSANGPRVRYTTHTHTNIGRTHTHSGSQDQTYEKGKKAPAEWNHGQLQQSDKYMYAPNSVYVILSKWHAFFIPLFLFSSSFFTRPPPHSRSIFGCKILFCHFLAWFFGAIVLFALEFHSFIIFNVSFLFFSYPFMVSHSNIGCLFFSLPFQSFLFYSFLRAIFFSIFL